MTSLFLMMLQSVPPWAVGALVSIGLFLALHLGVAIWFASGIKAQVAQLVSASDRMAAELSELGKLDGRLQRIETRVDRAERDIRDSIQAAAERGRHMPAS